MQYYVYENWLHNYTKIHKGGCRFCNDGKGRFPEQVYDETNGTWWGPYDTLKMAELVAEHKRRKAKLRCTRCL